MITLTEIASDIALTFETRAELPYRLDIDTIKDLNHDGGCVRYSPAPFSQNRYIDGSGSTVYSLSIYFRMKRADDCRNIAQKVIDIADGRWVGQVFIRAQNAPQFIEQDGDWTVYQILIKARLEIKGDDIWDRL